MTQNFCSISILLLIAGSIYGRKPNTIIGPAAIACRNEQKYQVSLWAKPSDTNEIDSSFVCGGAILDKNHILTAAHCVEDAEPSDIMIKAGCHDRIYSSNWIYRDVIQICIHPEYHPMQIGKDELTINDIAVLTIDPPLPMNTPMLSALKLPEANVRSDQIGEIAGWGITEPGQQMEPSRFLLKTSMTILMQRDCPHLLPLTIFCAINRSSKTIIALGDSGGPFVIDNVVVGIASGGPAAAYAPNYFTNVFFFLDFIERVRSISENSVDHCQKPYLISVGIKKSLSSRPKYICGGVLLDKNQILTAAHCVVGSESSLIVINLILNGLNSDSAQSKSVEKVYIHPEYRHLQVNRSTYFVHDIAILTLRSPIFFDCAMGVNLPRSDVETGQIGEVLRVPAKDAFRPSKSMMTVLGPESCALPFPMNATQFCANEATKKMILDDVDSGSPFISNKKIIGIVSYVHPDSKIHTFCTSIFPHLDFIRKVREEESHLSQISSYHTNNMP